MSVNLPKPEEVGVFYDRFTRLFEILWGDSLHFGYWPAATAAGTIEEGQERLTELMAAKVEANPGQHVLDVGCGTGRASIHLAQKTGCSLTGINISQQQVSAAERRASAMGVGERVRFQVADAMKMPFADSAYDGAWAFESLLHMPSLAKAAVELARVLKPGSRLVISDVVAMRAMSDEDDTYYRSVFPVAPLLSKESYLQTFRDAGFEIEETLDISAKVERTLQLTLENVDKRQAEIREVYGPEIAGALKESWTKGINIHLKSLGYLIVVARKPQARTGRP